MDNVPHTFVLGQSVACPRDRGETAYRGRIVHISDAINTNIYGVQYVWITVEKDGGKTRHVWPSNRLAN